VGFTVGSRGEVPGKRQPVLREQWQNDNDDNQHQVLTQWHPTDGPRATSGLRPLVTKSVKLFVNLLLVTTSSFILFTPKD
jgi:hypothetical protein